MHLVISEIFPFRWFYPNGRALLLRNTLDASAARRLRTASGHTALQNTHPIELSITHKPIEAIRNSRARLDSPELQTGTEG
jgi:hypothetical protein